MIKTRALIFFLIKEYLFIFNSKLTVHNYLDRSCYRCIYPKAPAPETVSNCSDSGIMGPVVGCIGSMQALEAIKILSHTQDPASRVACSSMMVLTFRRASSNCVHVKFTRVICAKNVTVPWTWAHRYSDNYRERYRCNGRYLEPYHDDNREGHRHRQTQGIFQDAGQMPWKQMGNKIILDKWYIVFG